MSMINKKIKIENIVARLHSSHHIKIGAASAIKCVYPINELFDISVSSERVTLFDPSNIHMAESGTHITQEEIDNLGDILYVFSADTVHHNYGTMRAYDLTITKVCNYA